MQYPKGVDLINICSVRAFSEQGNNYFQHVSEKYFFTHAWLSLVRTNTEWEFSPANHNKRIYSHGLITIRIQRFQPTKKPTHSAVSLPQSKEYSSTQISCYYKLQKFIGAIFIGSMHTKLPLNESWNNRAVRCSAKWEFVMWWQLLQLRNASCIWSRSMCFFVFLSFFFLR